jgi:hypothetical protein
MSEFSLTLLTQMRTRLALALEVLGRVFERHAVALEECVQVVPRRNVEQTTHLHACQASVDTQNRPLVDTAKPAIN